MRKLKREGKAANDKQYADVAEQQAEWGSEEDRANVGKNKSWLDKAAESHGCPQ